MRIAIDAMGGDYAPEEIVKGAVEAANNFNGQLILVGNEKIIKELLIKYQATADNIEIYPASEIIAMDEHPASAVRKKKDSSIVVATRMVKEGQADAVISAGSTGAAMAAALFILGRIKGIDRPGIIGVLPNIADRTYIVDVGANVDSKPKNLGQFALMGNIYARQVVGLAEPRVGLLSNGSEDSKGNELVQETLPLLKQMDINFIGNVEGPDIFNNSVDVVICDGFVGNCVLKTAEGVAGAMVTMLKDQLAGSAAAKVGIMLLYNRLKDLKRKLDAAEYGGAPLLGVNGISIISHGSSRAKAIVSSIKVAQEAVEENLIALIQHSIAQELTEQQESQQQESQQQETQPGQNG